MLQMDSNSPARHSALEFETYKKEGGKSLLDVGGKIAIDLCQYTIRQLPRYKAFASSPRQARADPQRPNRQEPFTEVTA
jgi:hypothetical protein